VAVPDPEKKPRLTQQANVFLNVVILPPAFRIEDAVEWLTDIPEGWPLMSCDESAAFDAIYLREDERRLLCCSAPRDYGAGADVVHLRCPGFGVLATPAAYATLKGVHHNRPQLHGPGGGPGRPPSGDGVHRRHGVDSAAGQSGAMVRGAHQYAGRTWPALQRGQVGSTGPKSGARRPCLWAGQGAGQPPAGKTTHGGTPVNGSGGGQGHAGGVAERGWALAGNVAGAGPAPGSGHVWSLGIPAGVQMRMHRRKGDWRAIPGPRVHPGGRSAAGCGLQEGPERAGPTASGHRRRGHLRDGRVGDRHGRSRGLARGPGQDGGGAVGSAPQPGDQLHGAGDHRRGDGGRRGGGTRAGAGSHGGSGGGRH